MARGGEGKSDGIGELMKYPLLSHLKINRKTAPPKDSAWEGSKLSARQRKARPKSGFMIARSLVATALFARDRAAIPFDRGSHRAAVLALPWANGDAAWADTNGGV
jgi:hypothetical protein